MSGFKTRAIVTGGSRGIGAACARALAERGNSVLINYVSSKEAAEAVARETGGAAYMADVSDADAVGEMVKSVGGRAYSW